MSREREFVTSTPTSPKPTWSGYWPNDWRSKRGWREVVRALDSRQVPYLLVGSFSSNYFGIPRSTKDVDIVIELGQDSVADIVRSLGSGFSLQPQVGFESVTGTTQYVVDVAGTHFKVELFRIGNDPHDRERFARRLQVPWLAQQVWLPTAEDVIITKLRWLSHLQRNKDYDDVLNVMSVQQPRLDWAYLERWCQVHGTKTLLDEIRVAIVKA
jgi:Nucleotidyl transferase AbiEii toxin, Type IV TA system